MNNKTKFIKPNITSERPLEPSLKKDYFIPTQITREIVLPFLLRNSRYRLSIILGPPPSRLGTRTVPFIQAPNEACVKEFLLPRYLQEQWYAPLSVPHQPPEQSKK